MKANPNKFQFMVISSKPMEPQNIEWHGGVNITSEPSVKILGVVIDDRLNFDEHISMCCTKAARQLNALVRIFKYFNFKSKSIIYNSFILSNFNYCPLARFFCVKQIVRSLRSYKSGHWEYCIVILFPTRTLGEHIKWVVSDDKN